MSQNSESFQKAIINLFVENNKDFTWISQNSPSKRNHKKLTFLAETSANEIWGGGGLKTKSHTEIFYLPFCIFADEAMHVKKKNISSFRFRGAVDRKIFTVNIIIIFILLLYSFQLFKSEDCKK